MTSSQWFSFLFQLHFKTSWDLCLNEYILIPRPSSKPEDSWSRKQVLNTYSCNRRYPDESAGDLVWNPLMLVGLLKSSLHSSTSSLEQTALLYRGWDLTKAETALSEGGGFNKSFEITFHSQLYTMFTLKHNCVRYFGLSPGKFFPSVPFYPKIAAIPFQHSCHNHLLLVILVPCWDYSPIPCAASTPWPELTTIYREHTKFLGTGQSE